jgi:serine/threonine-protein phosphatase PP1 catalytic subunit
LQDLVRIFRHYGLDSAFLFLGDYLNRGGFSIECILFLLTLSCKYPDRYFLLRGNHETRSIASTHGFKSDVIGLYSLDVFEKFISVFEWMPLAAVINRSTFCVHGGIGPDLNQVSQINELQRPLRGA